MPGHRPAVQPKTPLCRCDQTLHHQANVVDVPAVGLRHQKTAAFFSGGVDAFFTVLKHGDPAGARDTSIDHLLHVW